jgi:hypothetical protein
VEPLLLRAGADKDAKNNDGSTALHLAAERGHRECVEPLLLADADPFLRATCQTLDSRQIGNATPRELARDFDIARLLARAELRARLTALAAAAARGELFDAPSKVLQQPPLLARGRKLCLTCAQQPLTAIRASGGAALCALRVSSVGEAGPVPQRREKRRRRAEAL